MFSAIRMVGSPPGEEEPASLRTSTAMTVAERQLSKKLIEERDDRIKSVNELWAAVKELQAGTSKAPDAAADAGGSFGSRLDRLRTDMEADIANMRAELSLHPKALSELEALRIAQRKVELQVQELQAKIITIAMQPQSSSRQPSKTLDASNAEGSAAAPPAVAQQIEDLWHSLQAIENLQEGQSQDLMSFRQVLVEMHISLPLHAVRASRMALRSSELCKEERQQALLSLEEKERAIKLDIDEFIKEHPNAMAALGHTHKASV